MRITEFALPEPTTPSLSAEDEARVTNVVKQGNSAWSTPLTLEEAIAATMKAMGAA